MEQVDNLLKRFFFITENTPKPQRSPAELCHVWDCALQSGICCARYESSYGLLPFQSTLWHLFATTLRQDIQRFTDSPLFGLVIYVSLAYRKLGHECQLAGQLQTQKGAGHVQNVLYELLPVPSKSSALWFQTLSYRMYLYRFRYKQAQNPDVALPWQHTRKTNLLFFWDSPVKLDVTGDSKNGAMEHTCRAAPGDPGRGSQWDKSWWVGRDGMHKAAAVIKHYWGSEVIEGQIKQQHKAA